LLVAARLVLAVGLTLFPAAVAAQTLGCAGIAPAASISIG
jgi:hypothetical protein